MKISEAMDGEPWLDQGFQGRPGGVRGSAGEGSRFDSAPTAELLGIRARQKFSMQPGRWKSADPRLTEDTSQQKTRAVTILALLLLPMLALLYTRNPGLGSVAETIAAWETVVSIVSQGDLDLDEFHPSALQGEDPNYAVVWRYGRLLGIEPLASPLTFTPIAWVLQTLRGPLACWLCSTPAIRASGEGRMTRNVTLTKCFNEGRKNDQEPYLNEMFQQLRFRCARLKRRVATADRGVEFPGAKPLASVLQRSSSCRDQSPSIRRAPLLSFAGPNTPASTTHRSSTTSSCVAFRDVSSSAPTAAAS